MVVKRSFQLLFVTRILNNKIISSTQFLKFQSLAEELCVAIPDELSIAQELLWWFFEDC